MASIEPKGLRSEIPSNNGIVHSHQSHSVTLSKEFLRHFYVWFQPHIATEAIVGRFGNNLSSVHESWCVLGDFNTILRKEDRMDGDEVEDYELQELQSCFNSCELTEMPYLGAYYTWSNKTIWSRIDKH